MIAFNISLLHVVRKCGSTIWRFWLLLLPPDPNGTWSSYCCYSRVQCAMYNVQWISCVWNTDGYSRGMTHRTMVSTAIVLPCWNCTRVEWMHCSTFLVWTDRVHQISLQRIRKQDFLLLYRLEFIFCSTKRCTDRTRFFWHTQAYRIPNTSFGLLVVS